MYEIINIIHAWGRWFITIFMLIVLYRSYMGWRGQKAFEKTDNTMSLILMICCDMQLLTGLVLYIWLSPATSAALNDFGAAMKNPEARFWAMEHLSGMVIAILLIHVARSKSKVAIDSTLKHKHLFLFTLIGFALMMAVIPWPGTAANRALFPF